MQNPDDAYDQLFEQQTIAAKEEPPMTDRLDHNPDGLLPNALFQQSKSAPQFDQPVETLDLDDKVIAELNRTNDAGWDYADHYLARYRETIAALRQAQARIEHITLDNEDLQRRLMGSEEALSQTKAKIRERALQYLSDRFRKSRN